MEDVAPNANTARTGLEEMNIFRERGWRCRLTVWTGHACLAAALALPNVPPGGPAEHRKMGAASGRVSTPVLGDNPDRNSSESVASIHGMSKLLAFHFDEGRPRMSPEQEAAIRAQVLLADPRRVLHEPSTTVIVAGYVDHSVDRHRSRQIAFRRAQIIVDLLRDRCGVEAATQVVTQPVKNLPTAEQQGKERLVEVWFAAL